MNQRFNWSLDADPQQQEAASQRTRELLATNQPRRNRKGQELKTDITDPDSAKKATSKSVIQGHALRLQLRRRLRNSAVYFLSSPAFICPPKSQNNRLRGVHFSGTCSVLP